MNLADKEKLTQLFGMLTEHDFVELEVVATQQRIMWLIWSNTIWHGKVLQVILVDILQKESEVILIMYEPREDRYLVAYLQPKLMSILPLLEQGMLFQIDVRQNGATIKVAQTSKGIIMANQDAIDGMVQEFAVELAKARQRRGGTWEKVYNAFFAKHPDIAPF